MVYLKRVDNAAGVVQSKQWLLQAVLLIDFRQRQVFFSSPPRSDQLWGSPMLLTNMQAYMGLIPAPRAKFKEYIG
jgi:hypothetical protein